MEKSKSAVGQPLLEIRDMTKTFGPVVALDRVDLTVLSGEIRGLIGENGSGKSTISSVFSGMQTADHGVMTFEGKPWQPSDMSDALRRGVGMIVQESGTVPGITVAENLFLCRMGRFSVFRTPSDRGWGFVSSRNLFRAAQEALDEIGAGHIRAEALTGTLDMMDRKLIEVAKVWISRPRVLVVDESTTALSQRGREIVYGLMERIKADGGAVVFISHDLDEIMEKCDTLTVLRDGRIIRTFEKAEFEAGAIRTAMIGRDLQGDYYRTDYGSPRAGRVTVEVTDLSVGDRLHGVSFSAHEGEILGIGGLSHCGMHTLGKVLFGAVKPSGGNVRVLGKPLRDPSDAISRGVGYASKDRDTESLCLSASVRDNISIAGFPVFAPRGVISPKRERAYVRRQIEGMQIKCFSQDQPIEQLSGGNKQKAVFGKWIGAGSRILILDCPTRGIDIGVKQTMYRLMARMREEGKTVIMISEELPELIGMSDRILIMKDGRISGEYPRARDLRDADLIGDMI